MSVTHLQPEQLKKLKTTLDEISNSMAHMEGHREFIKEAKKKVKAELQLDSKLISRLAKVHHKKTFEEEVSSDEEFAATYAFVAKTNGQA